MPVALKPDDLGLIWSGSAVVDADGTSGFFDGNPGLVALYTNASGKDYEDQAQSLAYSRDRGRTWTKYADNPVIPNPDNPDFRVKAYAAGGEARFISFEAYEMDSVQA